MNKIIAPAIGITFLVQLVVFLIGLGNNVIISRLLGPESLGIFAIIIVVVELVFRIVNPGIDTSAIYFISNKRFEFKEYVSTYLINIIVIIGSGILILLLLNQIESVILFSEVINFNFISDFFAVIVFYFAAFLLYEFGVKIPLGLEKYNEYNKIQLLKPIILFTLLIISSLMFTVELGSVIVLVSISFIIPALLYWRFALPINLTWRKEPAEKSFRFGIKIMLGNLLQYLNYRTDILLIGFFLSGTEIGWYYVSVLIAERLLFLTQATSTILFPSASGSDIQREKTPILSRLNFTVVFAGSMVIGATAYWLVPLLFSAEYSNSVLPLIVILPGIISLSVSKILSADFTSRGLPQYSLYVSLLNFILNIAFNIILIPNYGIAGAAISSSLSYSAALILQIYFYHRLTNTKLSELIFMRNGDLKKLKSI
ncbi:MAG TPA: oligosaccharide flippase family protein [Ignavibacteriaceae bacterium]|nr:oligosaccharide flippase family protein [Ignavibacteriaceae bacterium]